MANKKKLKDYFNLGMRKLKHRKGFGVHSPFAFSIITEVIEEKLPYYAYSTMQPVYGKQATIPFKAACLLFRLVNRFKCKNIAQLGCDGGYTILPLLMADSRNRIYTIASTEEQEEVLSRLSLFQISPERIIWTRPTENLTNDTKYDMIMVSHNPFTSSKGGKATDEETNRLLEWVLSHSKEETLIFVNGILPRQELEIFWDTLCDRDDITITMDLYNNGFAILKPRFYKQHYIVSF